MSLKRIVALVAPRFMRLGQGIVLGIGAPIGWLVLCRLFSLDPSNQYYELLLFAYMTLGTASVVGFFGYRIGIREQKLSELAVFDPLTKLYNAGAFRQRFGETFSHSQRHSTPLSLIILDIDFFKRVNDTYGHQAGDVVLKEVAALMKRSIREGDIAARVGGEEFAMLLPFSDEKGAAKLAERVRVELAAMAIPLPSGAVVRVQASQGVASLNGIQSETPEEMFRKADGALYEAKRGGRNRVVIARPETEPEKGAV